MDTISLGLQPMLIFLAVFTVAIISFFIVILVARSKTPEHTGYDEMDKSDFSMVAVLFGIFGVAPFTLIAFFTFLPFDAKYYQYYEVSGTVTSVSNVFEQYKGEFTSEPVVVLDNGNVPLVVDDPRILSFQDREVDLLCTVSWTYLAEDRWNCKIREAGY